MRLHLLCGIVVGWLLCTSSAQATNKTPTGKTAAEVLAKIKKDYKPDRSGEWFSGSDPLWNDIHVNEMGDIIAESRMWNNRFFNRLFGHTDYYLLQERPVEGKDLTLYVNISGPYKRFALDGGQLVGSMEFRVEKPHGKDTVLVQEFRVKRHIDRKDGTGREVDRELISEHVLDAHFAHLGGGN